MIWVLRVKDLDIPALVEKRALQLIAFQEEKPAAVRRSLTGAQVFCLIGSKNFCRRLSDFVGVPLKSLSELSPSEFQQIPSFADLEHGDSLVLVREENGFRFRFWKLFVKFLDY